MTRLLTHALDVIKGKAPVNVMRHPSWPTFRRAFIKDRCAVCPKTKGLELHHIIPYHIDPTLELNPENVITLCRDCHFDIGHLKYWRSYNPEVRGDAIYWRAKIANRP